MEVLTLMIFVTLTLVLAAMAFFVWNVRARTYDHLERLSLLPLDRRDAPRVDRARAPGTDLGGSRERGASAPETRKANTR